MSHCVVFITVPNEAVAQRVSDTLLEARLVACVNIIHDIRSLYIWKEERQDDPEFLMIAKTRLERFQELVEAVRLVHPYEVPEIIALPIVVGDAPYLAWIDENVI
jgi:periplasmic divalent cation tolerance protein